MTGRVRFTREGASFYDRYVVLLDGDPMFEVKKRVEVYTGIQRGGVYTYWDAYPIGKHSRIERLATDSTRRDATLRAFSALDIGLDIDELRDELTGRG